MFLPTAPNRLIAIGMNEKGVPLTVVITVMSGNLISHADGLDNPKRDITSLSKQFSIVAAIMLDWVA